MNGEFNEARELEAADDMAVALAWAFATIPLRTFELADGTNQHVVTTERPDLAEWPQEIEN